MYVAGQLCRQKFLLNNGVCDEEIITDYECLFDYPDCTEDLRREVECNFAVQQSYIGCEIAIEMFLNYPYCEGIHLCCPDLRSDSNFYYEVLAYTAVALLLKLCIVHT